MSDHNISILWPFFEDEPILQALSEEVAVVENSNLLFMRLLPSLLIEEEDYKYAGVLSTSTRGVKLNSSRLHSILLSRGFRVR